MKAVMVRVDNRLLDERRRSGADQWDEMWEGVLHMPAMPNRFHQEIEFQFQQWLRKHWAQPCGGRVYQQVNLALPGRWPEKDYRIPDLILLSAERLRYDHGEYCDGPPLVVVEIRSPDDESYEKLDFYAELGVPEAWIIDRDTLRPEVYRLQGGKYVAAAPASDGWTSSPATGVEMRAGDAQRLHVRMADDHATAAAIPED